MKHGKKYVDSAKLIDRATQYDVAEALDIAVKTGRAKFDETVEVHVKLGQTVDGTVIQELPCLLLRSHYLPFSPDTKYHILRTSF